MKQFYKISGVILAVLIFAVPFITNAQPVTATWSLLTDQSVEITGAGAANVTATPQMLGSAFVGISYGYSTGTPAQTGFQRLGVTTGTPPVQGNYPTAFDTTNGYIQYSITPVAGQRFTLNSMSIEALGNGSGGSRLAAFYSLDGFATVDSFVATYNVGGTTPYGNFPTLATPIPLASTGSGTVYTGQQIATLTPRTGVTVSATSGQTLSVRYYYFNATLPTVSSKPLANKNMVINGTTSATALPLKLIDFNGRLNDGKVNLLWNTQNQINVKGFDVEKSLDGKSFKSAGFVNASNAGIQGNHYAFTDANTINGANYYRLKMIDRDGSYTYSPVVVVNTKLNNVLSVYPNPATTSITVTHGLVSVKTQLLLQDASGKTIKAINAVIGSTQTVVNVVALPKGYLFYIVW